MLGLRINLQKSTLEPTQVLEHLGVVIDTENGVFKLSEARVVKLRRLSKDILCRAAEHCRTAPKRQLASFLGLAQASSLAVPEAPLFLRELYNCLSSVEGWHSSTAVRLTHQGLKDLKWWINVDRQSRLTAHINLPVLDLHLYTDSSDLGWGAVLQRHNEADLIARGVWDLRQRLLHINIKELTCLRLALGTFSSVASGHNI
jgi:hypothetical protein